MRAPRGTPFRSTPAVASSSPDWMDRKLQRTNLPYPTWNVQHLLAVKVVLEDNDAAHNRWL